MNDTATFDLAGIVAPHQGAADAARDILIEGGNAIEAAVAAAAVVALALPARNGLGGDGSWLIREPGARGRTRVIDARGPVVAGATRLHFRDKGYDHLPRHGDDSVLTVPGAVAGWHAALDLSQAIGGRFPVGRLLEPAVTLARAGIGVSGQELRALAAAPTALTQGEGFAAAFLDAGKVPEVGFRRATPALAQTLAYLAHAGLDDFYRGDVGREIAAELALREHVLGRADLARFEAKWRSAARLDVHKASLESVGSAAGLTLLWALGLFERLKLRRAEGFDHLHGLIEALKAAQRRVSAADAAGEGAEALLGTARFEAEAEALDLKRASPMSEPAEAPESGIFIGVIDGAGLAVSLTQSLGGAYGSGVVLGQTGVLLGNRGSGLALDADHGPLLHPGRRPALASLPALLRHDDGRIALFGAGGAGAIAGAQIFARLRLGAGTRDAVAGPRFGFGQAPGTKEAALLLEEGFDPSAVAALGRAGHPVIEGAPAADAAGLLRLCAKGRIEAAPDAREAGAAAGF